MLLAGQPASCPHQVPTPITSTFSSRGAGLMATGTGAAEGAQGIEAMTTRTGPGHVGTFINIWKGNRAMGDTGA